MMFDRFISERARLDPSALAVLTPGGSVSYAAFDADVNRFAAWLSSLGVPRSGAVAVHLTSPYARWATLLALARLGIASTPPGDPDASFLITDTSRRNDKPGVHLDPAMLERIRALPPSPVATADVDPDALGRVLFSSGTTGRPKKVAYSWRWLDVMIRSTLATHDDGSPIRAVAQPGIDMTLGFLLPPSGWAAGGSIIFGVDLATLPACLVTMRPTVLSLAPVQLQALLTMLPRDARPLPNLRIFIGGSRLPGSLASLARARLAPRIIVTYGATECGNVAHGDSTLLDAHPGAAGYVDPGVQVQIVDDVGTVLPVGATGLVRIRSASVLGGYMDAEPGGGAFRDGWFYPGDIGQLDPDGLLCIAGRADEVMNLGGVKLLPDAVEDVVLGCAGVQDAAAFTAADVSGLERLWVGVVAIKQFDEHVAASAIRAAFAEMPSAHFLKLPSIPRGMTGKIDREQLRRLAAEAQLL